MTDIFSGIFLSAKEVHMFEFIYEKCFSNIHTLSIIFSNIEESQTFVSE